FMVQDGQLEERNLEADGDADRAGGSGRLLADLDGDLQRVVLETEEERGQGAVHGLLKDGLVAIALAIAELDAGALDPHLDPVLAAVAAVSRCVAERVVALEILPQAVEAGEEVVGVQDRPAAGLVRQEL